MSARWVFVTRPLRARQVSGAAGVLITPDLESVVEFGERVKQFRKDEVEYHDSDNGRREKEVSCHGIMFLVCYCAVVTCGLLSAQRCLPHLPPDAHVQERKLKKQQRQDATSALAAAHQSARGEAGLSVSNIQKILDDIDAMTGVDLQHHADEFGIESGGAGESGEDTDGDVEHGDALDVAALRAKLRTHLQSLLHSQTHGSAGGKNRGRQAHAASRPGGLLWLLCLLSWLCLPLCLCLPLYLALCAQGLTMPAAYPTPRCSCCTH